MPNATQTALQGLRKRDLIEFLETDPRVREWLAGPSDADGTPGLSIADNGALISTKAAAVILGVERSRVWRWENAGRLQRVFTTGPTPLYLRSEVERLAAEEREKAQRRARAAEGS